MVLCSSRYSYIFRLTGDTMALWLAQGEVEVAWDEDAKEHIFSDASGRKCAFPTPLFVKHRLELVQALKLGGVAIWEGGHMMPMLIDMF
jgi:GH18 family chitinase